MEMRDYQNQIRPYEQIRPLDELLLGEAMLLAEESAEVLALVRKHRFCGQRLEVAKVIEELGDTLWALANIATTLGVPLDVVAVTNAHKLARRYPEGHFSPEKCAERADELLTWDVSDEQREGVRHVPHPIRCTAVCPIPQLGGCADVAHHCLLDPGHEGDHEWPCGSPMPILVREEAGGRRIMRRGERKP